MAPEAHPGPWLRKTNSPLKLLSLPPGQVPAVPHPAQVREVPGGQGADHRDDAAVAHEVSNDRSEKQEFLLPREKPRHYVVSSLKSIGRNLSFS